MRERNPKSAGPRAGSESPPLPGTRLPRPRLNARSSRERVLGVEVAAGHRGSGPAAERGEAGRAVGRDPGRPAPSRGAPGGLPQGCRGDGRGGPRATRSRGRAADRPRAGVVRPGRGGCPPHVEQRRWPDRPDRQAEPRRQHLGVLRRRQPAGGERLRGIGAVQVRGADLAPATSTALCRAASASRSSRPGWRRSTTLARARPPPPPGRGRAAPKSRCSASAGWRRSGWTWSGRWPRSSRRWGRRAGRIATC